jgi:2-keto-4-pentenoate hydratase
VARLSPAAVDEAASIVWTNWSASTRIAALPDSSRPVTRAEGYAIQAAVAARSGQRSLGWKIAATSAAGQKHIAVDGPLAGQLLESRVQFGPGRFVLGDNLMRAGEAEFAFRMAADLPPRGKTYSVEEVMEAVASAHPSIEIPDSRYQDFTVVGAPQLIADTACACWLAIGPAFDETWRSLDLATHEVSMFIGSEKAASGFGKAVLGGPPLALAWIANELAEYGDGLKAGEYVTTGTCIVPVTISAGMTLTADYGSLGSLSVALD